MAGTKSLRLSAYAALLFIAIGVVELVASLLFYREIDANTLREDHARRVAEMLVVSNRVYRLEPRLTPAVMTSEHLRVSVAETPLVARPASGELLQGMARQIVRWEPTLAGAPLHLATRRAANGRRDLVGSMPLGGGRWLNFESRDISSMWPIALRAAWMTVVTALVCVAAGLLAIRALTRPLRRMSEAANAIGQGQRVAIREEGPTDLRNLSHAMNEMQDRIARLLEDQAKSFEAISHDLRTPLSRQKVLAELLSDQEISDLLLQSVDEMDAMLGSLQQFLRAQHLQAAPEQVDLVALLQDMIADGNSGARLRSEGEAWVETYREPLLLSLEAVIENALRYGEKVEVRLEQEGSDWFVVIADDGPGIPAEHVEDVLTPFFRLDEARGRTTKGFGLGIPTAHRLLTRFGGKLSLSAAPEGGLIVRVRVPQPI
ncbi:ATP-binding protein [Novosphingobium sp. M1R2S20]|uniref:histidine kinase n=1 Tax=Novosphingobium rhizovicinum TaxID=3228928 RepID=A0ABV3RBJ2_9SPHN